MTALRSAVAFLNRERRAGRIHQWGLERGSQHQGWFAWVTPPRGYQAFASSRNPLTAAKHAVSGALEKP